jgi:hypothetical protein
MGLNTQKRQWITIVLTSIAIFIMLASGMVYGFIVLWEKVFPPLPESEKSLYMFEAEAQLESIFHEDFVATDANPRRYQAGSTVDLNLKRKPDFTFSVQASINQGKVELDRSDQILTIHVNLINHDARDSLKPILDTIFDEDDKVSLHTNLPQNPSDPYIPYSKYEEKYANEINYSLTIDIVSKPEAQETELEKIVTLISSFKDRELQISYLTATYYHPDKLAWARIRLDKEKISGIQKLEDITEFLIPIKRDK